jgi:cell division protease FtsH
MDKKQHFHFWYLVLALFGVLFLQQWISQAQQVERIDYSKFQSLLQQGQVVRALVTENQIRGELKTPLESGATAFVTHRVPPDIAADLAKHGVDYAGGTESTLLRDILSWLFPVLLFAAIWIFVIRRTADRFGAGGMLSIGKNKAKILVEKNTGVGFDDVAGVDEAKEELQEIVAFLKQPETYGRLGARMPKGILLVGPPGTGKTLLARAVAGEAGVPFFQMSGSEFVELFVGVGAARVRDLFEQARKSAPCIIFIDELDALGRARGLSPLGGGHDEKEQTLNQLLAELDGFDPSTGVVLLAATNRPEVLDPALLRAGRFDRQVLVDRPDRTGRIAILRVHIRKVRLAPEVAIEEIAALTPGFTGADLANLVNEAATMATRRGGTEVTLDDFTLAVERIVAGLEKKNRLLNEMERRVVANHEMGHALVAMALPGTDVVHKVSIIPRGVGALGYTLQRPTEDRFLMTRKELENKMAVLLGGRAAESLIFDELSTGAADDLSKVTEIARSMVTRYGLVESMGQVTYETDPAPFLQQPGGIPQFGQVRRYSEETAREIDCAVRELVETAYERARAVLERHRALLERTAAELLARETLSEDQLKGVQAELRAKAPAMATS